VVTKLPMPGLQPDRVEFFFEKSRKALGLDYVDLYLIHTPIGIAMDKNNEKGLYIKFDGEGKVSI